MTKIYLCGGINGLDDAPCNDWRVSVIEATPRFVHLNPMRRDYRGRELESSAQIVSLDLRDIDACDALIVNATRPSWGTAMEVFYASRSGKLIAAFHGVDVHPSPWLRQHVHFLAPKLEECITWLKSELK